MTKWLSLYIQHSYMLLLHKRPATPPQLLHEWQTFRNFAIVKQNKKINSLDRKNFFLDRKKMTNVECWMVGGADEEWGMKSEVIQQSIIQQSIIQHRQRRPFNIQHSTFNIAHRATIQQSTIQHRQRRPFNIQHSTFNIAQSATIQHSTLNIQHLKNYGN